MEYLLPILLVLPIVGAILCGLMPTGAAARAMALGVSLACAAIGVALLAGFNWSEGGVQYAVNLGSLRDIGFSFALGIDTISLWLIVLAVFLQPLAIAASFQSIQDRPQQYYAWMMALLTPMVGVFMARDLLLFYVFFELTLIPMFFIIGIWGGADRRYAAGKFFIFTFAGSVFTLAAIIYLGIQAGSFEIANVIEAARRLDQTALILVTLGLLIGFAVKVPLFPVHTWLPLAHTEAPTAGSVILAGVLLKLGTYGILRVALPIGFIWTTADGAAAQVVLLWLVRTVGVLCLIGIIYGALVAWVQQDIKKLVAYSSVSHLGFCVLGLAALNWEGVQGSVLYMINHGLSTGALFLCVGMIYDRYHTRDINALSGLGKKMPVLAFFLIFFTLSSIGLPGLNGFVSEFLTILGAFKSQYLGIGYGAIAAVGIILGAVYMLHMVARVIFGPLKTPGHEAHGHSHAHSQEDQGQAASPGHDGNHAGTLPDDLNIREMSILVPIAVVVVLLGVVPSALLRTLDGPTRELIGPADQPRAALVAEKLVAEK